MSLPIATSPPDSTRGPVPARASAPGPSRAAPSGSPRAAAAPGSPRAAADRMVVVTRPVEGIAPWPFLRAGAGEARGFWARGERWVAHRGLAMVVSAEGPGRFGAVREAVAMRVPPAPEGVRVRLYGGFAFRDDHHGEGQWAAFPAALLHLPTLELTGDATGQGRLRAQAVVGAGDDEDAVRASLEALLDQVGAQLGDGEGGADADAEAGAALDAAAGATPGGVDFGAGAGAGAARIPGRLTESDRAAWGAAVEAVLSAVGEGRLSKAVLARTLDVTLDGGGIPPVALAATLWRRNPGTHVFFFEPEPGQALVGAAPEALATVRSGIFHATAVAGSVARGTDAQADRWLARQLLDSRKDRAEHAMVVDDMVGRLARFATGVKTDPQPSVLTLARIQHLETGVRARLEPGVHVLDLVEALHPTPAVCGVPRDDALAFLRGHEPFDRGWYAGPVGWFSTDGDGHFVPALRTAVGNGAQWRLYAGAGVVDGSSAQGEWDETAIKFQPVLRALGACGAELPAEADEGPGR